MSSLLRGPLRGPCDRRQGRAHRRSSLTACWLLRARVSGLLISRTAGIAHRRRVYSASTKRSSARWGRPHLLRVLLINRVHAPPAAWSFCPPGRGLRPYTPLQTPPRARILFSCEHGGHLLLGLYKRPSVLTTTPRLPSGCGQDRHSSCKQGRGSCAHGGTIAAFLVVDVRRPEDFLVAAFLRR